MTTEHIDLNVGYSGNWTISPRYDATTSYNAEEALLYVGEEGLTQRPVASEYDFIGAPAGGMFYRLPANQNPSLLYLGFAGYGVPSGLDRYNPSVESKGRITGNFAWVKVSLADVKHYSANGSPGSGVFSLWEDGFSPKVFMSSYNDGVANPNANGLDTTDGISADDALWILAGSHNHFNFGFSQPGRYEVDLHVSAYFGDDGLTTPNAAGLQATTVPIRLYFSVTNVGQLEFDASSYTVNEDIGAASITVRRTGGSDGRITVNYASSNGTATAGDDYASVSGTLTFNDQETEKTIIIPITNDAQDEPDETIVVTLSAAGPTSIDGYLKNHQDDPNGLLGSVTTATLTVVDDDLPPNTPPTISDISSQSTVENTPTGPIAFTIDDAETAAGDLVVTAISSDPSLVPHENISVGGSGLNRTLTITPAAGQIGVVLITVTVTDANGGTATDSFELTITPGPNTSPIAFDDRLYAKAGTTTVLPDLLANDVDFDGHSLELTGFTQPTSGTLSTGADGGLIYSAAIGYRGFDEFTYTVTDSRGATAIGTVVIAVGVIDLVHTDLEVNYLDGEWYFGIHADFDAEVHINSDEAVLLANPNTKVTLPPLPSSYNFLGASEGDSIWLLSEVQAVDQLWLGLSNEETPFGTLAGSIRVDLVSFSGPGHFSMFDSGPIGEPRVWMDTLDGINGPDDANVGGNVADYFTLIHHSHAHVNWAFTAAGRYTIGLRATATVNTTDGEGNPIQVLVTSPIATYFFDVDQLTGIPLTENPPIARDDFAAAVQNGSPVTINVLANDSSSPDENEALFVQSATGGMGTLTVSADSKSIIYTPHPTFVGIDTFTYSIIDENGGTATATVTITVEDGDLPPTVSLIDDVSIDEDSVAIVHFTAEDFETAAGQLQFSFLSSNTDLVPLGSIAISGPGPARTLTITPVADRFGSTTITVTVIDSAGQSTTQTFVLTVNPVDDAPVANDDAYSVDEDGALTVGGNGVLANDTDADGDPLKAAIVRGPQNGRLTLNPDGSFTYVPNANFYGTDTFTYTTTDVRYQITPLGTLGGNTSFALDINNLGQATGNSGIIAGANNPLHAFLWTNGSLTDLGVVPGTGSNNFSRGYALNDFGVVVGESDNNVSKAFRWENGVIVNIGTLGGSSAVASDINNLGMIVGASSNGTASKPFVYIDGTMYELPTVAGNPGSTGRAWGISPDGRFIIGLSRVDDTQFLSQATLWERQTDGSYAETNLGSLVSDKHSLAYAVNNAGTAVGASVIGTVSPTSSTSLYHGFVYHNGEMIDIGTLSYRPTYIHSELKDINAGGQFVGYVAAIYNSPTFGGAAVLGDIVDGGTALIDLNQLVAPGSGWTLASAEGINDGRSIVGFGTFGGVTRAYLLTPVNPDGDGHVFGNTATVTITVNPLPDAPIATDDQFVVGMNNSVRGNVLFNDSDPDGDSISAAIATQPTAGTVNLAANGAFTYTPSAAFAGSDSFTYTVEDSTGRSSTATVTINAATPKDFEVILGRGHVDIGLFIGSGDEVIDHGGHTHTVTGEPAWDLHVHDHEVEKEYHADEALLYVGPQALTTRVSGLAGQAYDFLGVAAGEQFYMLPASQNPELLYLSLATEEIEPGTLQGGMARLYLRAVNGPGHFSMFGFTLDGPDVMFSTYDGITESDFVELLEGGHAHYNFAFSAAGRYEITFEAVGAVVGHDEVVTATTTYYFSVDNHGRVQFSSANYEVAEDGTQTITVERTGGSDGPLTVDYASVLSGTATSGVDYAPVYGSLTFGDGETTKTFTITTLPDTQFEGPESFQLQLTLPESSFAQLGTPVQANVTIQDDDPNTLPSIGELSDRFTSEDTPINDIAVIVGDAETAANSLILTATSNNTTLFPVGSINLGGSGANRTLTLTPAPNASGTATISVTVTDEHGGTSVETFVVVVSPVNDLPIIGSVANQTTAEDTPIVELPFAVGDVETAAEQLQVVATSSNTSLFPAGSIVLGGSGVNRRLTLTPAANAFGMTTITITVTDSDGGVSTQTFTVNVTPVNDLPTITPITNQTMSEDVPLTGLAFSVGDIETPAGMLSVNASSSNTQLFPQGSIIVSGTGSDRTLTLTPAANQSGSATISVSVTDGDGGTSTQTFTVVVAAVNDAPVAVGSTIVASPGQPTTGTLTATDIDGPALTYSIVVPPTKGTVTITNAATGAYTYTPNANATGTDSFQFQASDGTSVSAPATIEVTLLTGGQPNTVVKVGNDLVITGTPGNDQVFVTSLFGQTRIYLNGRMYGPFNVQGRIAVSTGDGNDYVLISSWQGPTFVDGGRGNDLIITGDGDDTIIGGAGDDVIYAGRGHNLVWGDDENAPHNSHGAGRDIITTLGGHNTLYGGGGNDLIVAGSGNDVIHAGDGDDTVFGGLGNDIIRGGKGIDSLDGGPGNNIVIQDENAAPTVSKIASQTMPAGGSLTSLAFSVGDLETAASALAVTAISSNTTLFPPGSIVLSGTGATRSVALTPAAGQAGTATISLSVRDEAGATAVESFVVTVTAGANPVPVLSQQNTVIRDGADLRITGTPSSDSVSVTSVGGQVFVVLNGRNHGPYQVSGQLWIETGDGADTITVQGWRGSTYVNAAAGNDFISTGDGNDTIFGGPGNDTIRAGGGDDYIDAGDGDDHVYGEAGNDLIRGGSGNDTLSGGSGDDIILGNDGADQLSGDAGRDLIIGGKGRDTVTDSDFDADIFIGGWTIYDLYTGPTSTTNHRSSNDVALQAIMDEWIRGAGSVTQRMQRIVNGGGLNGNATLVSGQTVHGDGDQDSLSSSVLSVDWLFAEVGLDKVTRQSNDPLNGS